MIGLAKTGEDDMEAKKTVTLDAEEARNYMYKLLTVMTKSGGSDLFIAKDFPPSMNINGRMVPLTDQPRPGSVTQQLVHSLMTQQQRSEFEQQLESNFAIAVEGLARFRVNVLLQQQHIGMVL